MRVTSERAGFDLRDIHKWIQDKKLHKKKWVCMSPGGERRTLIIPPRVIRIIPILCGIAKFNKTFCVICYKKQNDSKNALCNLVDFFCADLGQLGKFAFLGRN